MIRGGPGSGSGLIKGCEFLFFFIETLNDRSVVKMAATVYEKDNCDFEGSAENVTFQIN